MSIKKRICILSFSNIERDARVLREIEAARRFYTVDVIGYGQWKAPEGTRFFSLHPILPPPWVRYSLYLLGRIYRECWENLYWRRGDYAQASKLVQQGHYDLVHANDWDSLPAAVRGAGGTPTRVLYDAHEYTPGQTDRLLNRLLLFPYRSYLLRKYHPQTAATITVSGGLKDLYQQNFGWEAEVILNAPAYVKSEFCPVDPAHIRLMHHGGALAGRKLEDFLRMAGLLDARYTLSMMLTGNPAYIAELKALAAQVAPGRVEFLDPVLPGEIVGKLSGFDLGLPMMSAQGLNNLNALPNKFFEFIMAGMGIAVTQLPMMQRIVEENQIGVVAAQRDYRSLAKSLNDLDPQRIPDFKRSALKLAASMNAETEMSKLMSIYERLTAG